MRKPRVLIADDHRLMGDAFAGMLRGRFEIVDVVEDGRALLEAAGRLRPDLVVCDVGMPLLDGVEACRLLRRDFPELGIVVVTMHEDPELAVGALRAGAHAFLLKTDGARVFAEALQAALSGSVYVSPTIRDVVQRRMTEAAPRPGLTPRQREILAGLARGLSMKEVAHELGITPRTVAFHKYRIMERVGIDSSAGLVRLAIEEGLAPPPSPRSLREGASGG